VIAFQQMEWADDLESNFTPQRLVAMTVLEEVVVEDVSIPLNGTSAHTPCPRQGGAGGGGELD
jgi:hypothetical protein